MIHYCEFRSIHPQVQEHLTITADKINKCTPDLSIIGILIHHRIISL